MKDGRAGEQQLSRERQLSVVFVTQAVLCLGLPTLVFVST